jgi:diketogulonate reductase-like aldo/keto reductase
MIDLYQMHLPPSDDNREKLAEAWGTLAELKREGRVRWIGVSSFSARQLQFAAKLAPITA